MNRSIALVSFVLLGIALLSCNGGEDSAFNETPAALSSPTVSPGQPTAVPSQATNKIAFVALAPLSVESNIYAINADGSGLIQLTSSGSEYNPVPSADGCRIAFISARDSSLVLRGTTRSIYVMNADGSRQTKLTTENPINPGLAWSPDRSQIAYQTARDGNWELYRMNADGSATLRLTNHQATDEDADWSRTSSKIIFVRVIPTGAPNDADYHIYSMNPDGSQPALLTDAGLQPAWSLDASRIAFVSYRDNGSGEIYVMNADGSRQTRLTNNQEAETHPSWSPDGSRIAYASWDGRNWDIFAMNADGSGRTQLTTDPGNDGLATHSPGFAWSPDGRRIAFVSERDVGFQLYVMNADGSRQTRLSNHPELAIVSSPVWFTPATNC